MVNVGEPKQEMSPTGFLKEWSEKNPKQSAIVLAGVACFAAVAVVLGFGIDLQSNIKNVYYIIGAGVSVVILSRMLNNEIMSSTFTWFVFILAVLWTIAFIIYKAVLLPPLHHQRLACVVQFWEECKIVADNVAEASAPPIESKITAAIASVPKAEIGKNLKVYVQFAGSISRDKVRAMMRDLESKNWAVQGAQGGGERTVLAAGQSEVRYSGDNAAAAEALAKAVTAYGISGQPVKPVKNQLVPVGQLEVWISN